MPGDEREGGCTFGAGFAVLCCIVVPSIVLIFMSFASLGAIEYGLDFNVITMTLNPVTEAVAGLHFLGFGHFFIKYPRVIQMIDFSPGRRGLLHTRTADGLPLTLGVSFQYTYLQRSIYDLYLAYQQEQETVFVNTAKAVIANVACNYSAYTFFNDKAGIARTMQDELDQTYLRQLYAHIEAFQISQVELPETFQQAIVTSISTRQNITATMRYKDNMQVTFGQYIMEAEARKRQTVALANGTAAARMQQAQATARTTQQTVEAETAAFEAIASSLELTPSEALEYLWWDTLQASGDEAKEFLVGVNPAAYISGKT